MCEESQASETRYAQVRCKVDVTHLLVQGIMEGFANSACRGRVSGVEKKSLTWNLRVSPKLRAVSQPARREQRSMANMVEHLVLGHCEEHGLVPEQEFGGADDASLHS